MCFSTWSLEGTLNLKKKKKSKEFVSHQELVFKTLGLSQLCSLLCYDKTFYETRKEKQ